ncbi:hypothetical protein HaLaN_07970 [Haematococcus lacustris]|uniref:Uncharacterized protein n=1 Tax=Haematococcus lacustris TaxID=44745 RepID=A0A699YQA4_HAELA|nr:hypothetical protein HaLaN_07970 [Haematococcus lacustris]
MPLLPSGDSGAETLPKPSQGFELAGEVEETPSMPTDTPTQALCGPEPSPQAEVHVEQLMATLLVQMSESA